MSTQELLTEGEEQMLQQLAAVQHGHVKKGAYLFIDIGVSRLHLLPDLRLTLPPMSPGNVSVQKHGLTTWYSSYKIHSLAKHHLFRRDWTTNLQ